MDLWTSPTDRREPCGPCGQPVDNADALPTACPHSRASRPQAPQDQPPVILTRQHRTTLRRGCLHRPFRTTSASHSNPSQHRPRPGSPPILQAHFRMGLDWRDSEKSAVSEPEKQAEPIRSSTWSTRRTTMSGSPIRDSSGVRNALSVSVELASSRSVQSTALSPSVLDSRDLYRIETRRAYSDGLLNDYPWEHEGHHAHACRRFTEMPIIRFPETTRVPVV